MFTSSSSMLVHVWKQIEIYARTKGLNNPRLYQQKIQKLLSQFIKIINIFLGMYIKMILITGKGTLILSSYYLIIVLSYQSHIWIKN